MVTTEKAQRLRQQTRRPCGPGALLADFLENTGLTQTQAAKQLGVGRQAVNELINDRRTLTLEMANRLAILCGDDSPEIWLRLQQQRDLWDALHMDKTMFQDVQPYHKAA
jgi:addiction module HigA family antidote